MRSKDCSFAVLAVSAGLAILAFPSPALCLDSLDLFQVLPLATHFERKSQPVPHYPGYDANGQFVGVAFVTSEICPQESYGYQSVISTLVGVDTGGKILGVKILHQGESLGRKRVEFEGPFISQFIGKHAGDPFILDLDVDAITGATITSSAVSLSIRNSARIVSAEVLPLYLGDYGKSAIPERSSFLWFSFLEQWDIVFLFIILALVYGGYKKADRQIRYLAYGISFGYLGIWKGGGASIIDFLNIFEGTLHPFEAGLYWQILIILVLGLTIFGGRLYCGWICPFGAFSELLNAAPGPKFRIRRGLDAYLKSAKYVILSVLVFLVVLAGQFRIAIDLSNILEPFETLFTLYGSPLAWVWLVFVAVMSYFTARFFCRYFCPLGALLGLITTVSSWLGVTMVRIELPRGKECKGCGVAVQACGMCALSYHATGPRIDDGECIRCEECILFCPYCKMQKYGTAAPHLAKGPAAIH